MPNRSRAEEDMEEVQTAAARVLRHVVEATEGGSPATQVVKQDTRNAAAVALGKLGASKGGKARAKSLNKAQRKSIAKRAAKARWDKK